MDTAASGTRALSAAQKTLRFHGGSILRILGFSVFFSLLLLVLGGCTVFGPSVKNRQAASVVDYLYPASQPPEPAAPAVARLKLPLRVGLAFAPQNGMRQISSGERNEMLTRVKAAFADRPFIAQIEVIPEAYLRPRGGFENLDQVARMFQLDVVCLMSYDQIQYMDDNPLSMLYWTVVGAYVIPATKYSTHTLLDAAVFDVGSRRLLFRAPGVSHINANRPPAVASEYARESLGKGFEQALEQLIPALQTELDGFRERAKSDNMIKVESRPGYSGYRGGGAADLLVIILLSLIAGCYAHAIRPR